MKDVEVTPSAGCPARVVNKTGLGITAFNGGIDVTTSSKLVRFSLNYDGTQKAYDIAGIWEIERMRAR